MSQSIFNHVLGPVLHGPSSSHTAAAYHIAALVRSFLGEEPVEAHVAFDENGSWGQVYAQQGSDLAFTCGVLGWPIDDGRFFEALETARRQGVTVAFSVTTLPGAEHPNDMDVRFRGRSGGELRCRARSVGGGAVFLTEMDGHPVHLEGDAHDVVALVPSRECARAVCAALGRDGACPGEMSLADAKEGVHLVVSCRRAPSPEVRAALKALLAEECARSGFAESVLRVGTPVFFVPSGEPLFTSAAEAVRLAAERGCGLGEISRAYEAQLLGLSEEEVTAEMTRRYRIMRASVERGLCTEGDPMRLLDRSAGKVLAAEREGRLPQGGLHTRTAARALAAMHENSAMGVVVAAPTAGSAGVLPAVAVTLEEEWGLSEEQVVRSLFAASGVGLVVALRATFAAEVAGCQVEIGAAGAMAAAAVADAWGGSAQLACDAAAVAFQNTMGSICDPVQGCVEIPCHTRNAVAAASAFVCADLVAGGYVNAVPLDETVDAVYAVGTMLPAELRCTARGGLSLCPSALALPMRDLRASRRE